MMLWPGVLDTLNHTIDLHYFTKGMECERLMYFHYARHLFHGI